MIIEKSTGGGDFTPTEAGQHTGICNRVVDYGTHISTGMYAGKSQRKLMIAWEIPSLRVKFEKDGKEIEGPVIHIERYTWSFHENANLRAVLESWRGKQFVDEDFEGPKAFDMRNLIGVPALLQIVHNAKGEKIYANLQSIMKMPGKREDWPTLENDPVFLDLRNFDQTMFEKLSDYWQSLIKTTPEWAEMFGSEHQQQNGYGSENPGAEMDDEIPF